MRVDRIAQRPAAERPQHVYVSRIRGEPQHVQSNLPGDVNFALVHFATFMVS